MLWRNIRQRLSEIKTYWEDCTGRLTPLQARQRIAQIEPYRTEKLRQRLKRRLAEHEHVTRS